MKELLFTKVAENALTSLDRGEQEKAIKLLRAFSNDINDILLIGKVHKLYGITNDNLFSIRLNLKLRIIVERLDAEIRVVDVINHDLFERYFKKGNV